MKKRKIKENKVKLMYEGKPRKQYLPGINETDTRITGDQRAGREDHNAQL